MMNTLPECRACLILNYLFLNENKSSSIRTTVVGSYPFPSAGTCISTFNFFCKTDVDEMIEDAVQVAIQDQIASGLDVITDGEQTRLDFNLFFMDLSMALKGNNITPQMGTIHDQRGKHKITESLHADQGLRAVDEYLRLKD